MKRAESRNVERSLDLLIVTLKQRPATGSYFHHFRIDSLITCLKEEFL
jgi:hypothetical protein